MADDIKHTGTITPEPRKMADALARGGERLGEKLDNFGDNARDVYAKGRERVDVMSNDLGSYVQRQPVRSLLIAAGVGLVLGAVLIRRR
ncbi:MAG TPA: hypothetical protein VF530_03565 [Planctomycetota bacterium]